MPIFRTSQSRRRGAMETLLIGLLSVVAFGVVVLVDPRAMTSAAPNGGEQLGLRVADGFVVTRFADDDLAHDIYT
ncbi:MAG: hypothetical protein KDA63_09545, partial [Planctomycetales bacterium]|nr:hypothetical protein [Planctomycetales bacterium]